MNLQRISCTGLLLALNLSLPMPAAAQYVGPGGGGGAKGPVDSLSAINARPVDDQPVQLRGRISQKLSSDKYLFTDGSEQIRIELDDSLLPQHPINELTVVEIAGEVEKDFMETPEIDVERLTVISR